MRSSLALPTLLAATLLAASTRAEPVSMCIPEARGVSGRPGPPQWWAGSEQFLRSGAPAPDDPRWQGAFQHGFAFPGLPSESRLRAVRDADATYLYFGAWSETELSALALGFVARQGTGVERQIVIKISASPNRSGVSLNDSLVQVLEYSNWTRATGWELVPDGSSDAQRPREPADAGVTDQLVDRVAEWGGVLIGANTAARVLHVRVLRSELERRLGRSLSSPGEVSFWSALLRTDKEYEVPDYWPRAAVDELRRRDLARLLSARPPFATDRPTPIRLPAELAAPLLPTPGACPGLLLAPADIFIEHESLVRDTLASAPGTPEADTDDYVAAPRFDFDQDGQTDVDPDSVQGIFRASPWGSQGDSTADAAWLPLGPVTPDGRWVNASAADIRLNNCSQPDCAPQVPPAQQCLLVELRRNPNSPRPVTFFGDSAYRNITLISRSGFVVRKTAALGRVSTSFRDVAQVQLPGGPETEALFGDVFSYRVRFEPISLPGLSPAVDADGDEDLATFGDAPFESRSLLVGPALAVYVQRRDEQLDRELATSQTAFAYAFEPPPEATAVGARWSLTVGAPEFERTELSPERLSFDLQVRRGGAPVKLEIALESTLLGGAEGERPTPTEPLPLICNVVRGAGASERRSEWFGWALGALLALSVRRRSKV